MRDILEYAHHVSENWGKGVGRVFTQSVLVSVCGVHQALPNILTQL